MDGRSDRLKRNVKQLKPYKIRADIVDNTSDSNDNHDHHMSDDQQSSNNSGSNSAQTASNPSNQDQLIANCQSASSEPVMNKKVLLIVFLILSPANAFEFQEVPLVLWRPTKTCKSKSDSVRNVYKVRIISP